VEASYAFIELCLRLLVDPAGEIYLRDVVDRTIGGHQAAYQFNGVEDGELNSVSKCLDSGSFNFRQCGIREIGCRKHFPITGAPRYDYNTVGIPNNPFRGAAQNRRSSVIVFAANDHRPRFHSLGGPENPAIHPALLYHKTDFLRLTGGNRRNAFQKIIAN
jgi:hypothetical protein